MTIELPDLIRTYFDTAVAPDKEPWFALFDDDVEVEDEGRTYRGIDEVRAWRVDIPKVTYSVTDLAEDAGYPVATAEVAGDFPGSPVPLYFHFIDIEGNRIRRLAIRS
jgi:ketosteroid isomerase-like protein